MAQHDGKNDKNGPVLSMNRQQQDAINQLAESDPDAVIRVMRQWMQDPGTTPQKRSQDQ